MAKSRNVHSPEPERLRRIVFQSARIAEVRRVDAKSGSFKFHVKCGTGKTLSTLCEQMGWDMPGDKPVKEDLEGKLSGGSIVLRCQDKLVYADFDMPYNSIDGFQLLRLELEQRRGKGFRRELRFSGTFDFSEGCATMESYMNQTANAAGELTVTFTKEPKQSELPLASEEQRQAVLPEND